MYLSFRICMCVNVLSGECEDDGGGGTRPLRVLWVCVRFHPCLNDFSWVELRCERNTNFLQESGRRVWLGERWKNLQVRGIFLLPSIKNKLWMQRCVLLTVMVGKKSCFLSAKVPCSTCGLLCGYYIISMICRMYAPHLMPYSFNRFIWREHSAKMWLYWSHSKLSFLYLC